MLGALRALCGDEKLSLLSHKYALQVGQESVRAAPDRRGLVTNW